MRLCVVIFFIGAIEVTLVDSKCRYFHKDNEDINTLCKDWWNKGIKYDSRDRIKCVSLIKEKCPNMITITKRTKEREYYLSKPQYDTCTIQVSVLVSNTDKWMTYFETEYKPICSDDDGKIEDCHYWWTVVERAEVEDTYKEVCINSMMKHCKSSLIVLRETKVHDERHTRKGYDTIKVTYEYHDHVGSLYRYVPQTN